MKDGFAITVPVFINERKGRAAYILRHAQEPAKDLGEGCFPGSHATLQCHYPFHPAKGKDLDGNGGQFLFGAAGEFVFHRGAKIAQNVESSKLKACQPR